MKLLIIGCGSIGQRHIRNLISLKAGDLLVFDIDPYKLDKVKGEFSNLTVSDDLNILWKAKPSIAFIAVPNSWHIKYALEAAKKGCHLFIEKPLSHNLKGVDQLIELAKTKKLITMVGCNMRFYWAINSIKKLLEKRAVGKLISARIETGQYLPDWHPEEDYREMYSARKKLGGGVILDAIHEIDYSMSLFGEVKDVLCMFGRLSDLEIETEDVAELLLRFKDRLIVSIHLDYIQRVYSRSCKIIGEEGTIFWDFNDHKIKYFSAKTKRWREIDEPRGYDTNQMYIDEVRYFLSAVKNNRKTVNEVVDSLSALKVALKAKRTEFDE